ncbi:hypothetical protein [Streptomyces sp. NPDC059402]|uniref:hypothetical protein n=1 Tax=Streptomyces sp. NPDC059402 TaxID=3346822 RepID=UPI0036D167FF
MTAAGPSPRQSWQPHPTWPPSGAHSPPGGLLLAQELAAPADDSTSARLGASLDALRDTDAAQAAITLHTA